MSLRSLLVSLALLTLPAADPVAARTPGGDPPPVADLCPAGSFSFDGLAPCTAAHPGFFVPIPGATTQTPALPGSYAPVAGLSAALACPGGSFSYGGASACRAGTFTGEGTTGPVAELVGIGTSIDFGTVRLGGEATRTFGLRNAADFGGVGAGLTALTLLGADFQGDGAGFRLSRGDGLPLTTPLLLAQGIAQPMRLGFVPDRAGRFLAQLQLRTDQHADFGTPGDILTVNVTGIGVVPEPASWSMLITGFALTGTLLRRRQAAV